MRRVLRNLVDNALKFTDVGSVRIEARADLDVLVLRVIDTGRGIAANLRARVFEDYFQGDNPHRDRRQGLGLGLAIVRRLVQLLGGEVKVHSEIGRGATFEVRLPHAIDPAGLATGPGQQSTSRQPRLSVSRVLIVEDDELVIDAIATLFRTLGIEANYALDSDDALMQTTLGRFMPDIALVDFGLPGSMDGIALIRQLRVRLPRCVFLLITGDTRPEVIRRAADAGIETLHKPLSVDRLNEKLNALGIGH